MDIDQKVDNLLEDKGITSPRQSRKKPILAIATLVVIACTIIAAAVPTILFGTVDTTMHVVECGPDCQIYVYSSLENEFDGICVEDSVWTKNKIINPCDETACFTVESETFEGSVTGVNTQYYFLNGFSTLILENKNPTTWAPIQDDYQAIFMWNPCCPVFNWTCSGKMTAIGEYSIIYYADQQNRFTNWGGSPIIEIGRFNTSQTGDFYTFGAKDLDMCLPYADDWNVGPEANYTTSDGYVHGKGAKIWIVPTTDLTFSDGIIELTSWTPSCILFETDLIAYFDCDNDVCGDIAEAYFEYEDPDCGYCCTCITPGQEICLFIRHTFTEPDDYRVKTYIESCEV